MSHPRSSRRQLITLAHVLSWYPVLFPVCLYATWIVAWIALGHRPVPSLDDPKYISGTVSFLHTVTTLLMVGMPAALLLNGVAIVLAVVLSPGRRRETAMSLLAAASLWLLIVVMALTDPWNVFGWFLD